METTSTPGQGVPAKSTRGCASVIGFILLLVIGLAVQNFVPAIPGVTTPGSVFDFIHFGGKQADDCSPLRDQAKQVEQSARLSEQYYDADPRSDLTLASAVAWASEFKTFDRMTIGHEQCLSDQDKTLLSQGRTLITALGLD